MYVFPKSVGVIDVALKKLMSRNIVEKEHINENPKYTIVDPQAIVAWTKKHMAENVEAMQRKHQRFAQFMTTLSVEKHLPEIEHFAGVDGAIKAYERLL
jgi:hypothetical protein